MHTFLATNVSLQICAVKVTQNKTLSFGVSAIKTLFLAVLLIRSIKKRNQFSTYFDPFIQQAVLMSSGSVTKIVGGLLTSLIHSLSRPSQLGRM